jgi:uncharacterized membrane protein
VLLLILGIVLFLGTHSIATLRETRAGLIEKYGFGPYKIAYSALSLIGFVLIVKGFGVYRADAWVQVWNPPFWMAHITKLLMWFAFISLAAMNPKPGRIRGWLRHPMLVGIKIWALAHLLANGDLGGMLVFGSFLAWAVYDRISLKRRGDAGAPRIDHFTRADAMAVGIGTLVYGVMMMAHGYLIGVSAIG